MPDHQLTARPVQAPQDPLTTLFGERVDSAGMDFDFDVLKVRLKLNATQPGITILPPDPMPKGRPEKPRRQDWVDIARGVGIFLVVLGHLPVSPIFLTVLYSFHIPLFFFLSGLVFSRHQSFGAFTRHKVDTLLRPYLIFSLVSYSIWWCIRPFSNTAQQYDPWQTLLSIPYASNVPGLYLAHNMPLWFLPCLFVTMLLLYGILTLKRVWILPVIVLSVFVGSHWLGWFGERPLWSIDAALVGVLFLAAGYGIRKIYVPCKALPWPSLLVLGGLTLAYSLVNHKVDMNLEQYGNLFYFCGVAFSGILSVTELSKHLAHRLWIARPLRFLGENSLYIFAFHGMAWGLIHKGFERLHIQDLSLAPTLPNLGIHTMVLVCYIAVGLCISMLARKLLKGILFPKAAVKI